MNKIASGHRPTPIHHVSLLKEKNKMNKCSHCYNCITHKQTVMRIVIPSNFTSLPFPNLSRRHKLIVNDSSNSKKAQLQARRKERITLPTPHEGKGCHISEFLTDSSGIEAVLNTRALQSFQSIDNNIYRCSLPTIQLLNFEVAPIMDLRVTPTTEDCTLEMLSCKFEGSEIVERQNNKFSAFMRNHITWETKEAELYIYIDVILKLTLEIYARPFSLLPKSAVEKPGNLMMQALVDRLVPLLLEQLVQDYTNWIRQKNLQPSQ